MKFLQPISIVISILLLITNCEAQQKPQNLEIQSRIGFNYGIGNVQSFPFKSDSYIHDSRFYKLQYNLSIGERRNWSYAINVEPALYITDHYEMKDLRNQQRTETPRRLDKDLINEWVLNIGFQLQYKLIEQMKVYLLASVGPTFNDKETVRLNKGFAFSDILGLGLNWKIYSTLIDLRFSVRHVSNAGFNFPNRGYNSSAFEVGFSIPFNQ